MREVEHAPLTSSSRRGAAFDDDHLDDDDDFDSHHHHRRRRRQHSDDNDGNPLAVFLGQGKVIGVLVAVGLCLVAFAIIAGGGTGAHTSPSPSPSSSLTRAPSQRTLTPDDVPFGSSGAVHVDAADNGAASADNGAAAAPSSTSADVHVNPPVFPDVLVSDPGAGTITSGGTQSSSGVPPAAAAHVADASRVPVAEWTRRIPAAVAAANADANAAAAEAAAVPADTRPAYDQLDHTYRPPSSVTATAAHSGTAATGTAGADSPAPTVATTTIPPALVRSPLPVLSPDDFLDRIAPVSGFSTDLVRTRTGKKLLKRFENSEADVYEHMRALHLDSGVSIQDRHFSDEALATMYHKYVAKCYGRVELTQGMLEGVGLPYHESGNPFLVLESQVKHFTHPNILDLQLGDKYKVRTCFREYRARGNNLPMKVKGVKLFSPATVDYSFRDDCWWDGLTLHGAARGLREFFKSRRIVRKFLAQVRELRDLVMTQRAYVFHSSSLLFLYEGDPKAAAWDHEYRLKIIDFGHVRPYDRESLHHHEIPKGFDRLIEMMEGWLDEENAATRR